MHVIRVFPCARNVMGTTVVLWYCWPHVIDKIAKYWFNTDTDTAYGLLGSKGQEIRRFKCVSVWCSWCQCLGMGMGPGVLPSLQDLRVLFTPVEYPSF